MAYNYSTDALVWGSPHLPGSFKPSLFWLEVVRCLPTEKSVVTQDPDLHNSMPWFNGAFICGSFFLSPTSIYVSPQGSGTYKYPHTAMPTATHRCHILNHMVGGLPSSRNLWLGDWGAHMVQVYSCNHQIITVRCMGAHYCFKTGMHPWVATTCAQNVLRAEVTSISFLDFTSSLSDPEP
jgi:hypothetical protein